MSAYVIEKLCRGCQRCMRTCPNGAISMELSLAAVDSSKCLDCEECMEACMYRAIHFKRKKSKTKSKKTL